MKWFSFVRSKWQGIRIQKNWVVGPQAEFAINFIERWGNVAATPDGEDSGGRAKLRLQTPHELVERATETAQLLFESLDARGWIEPIPEEILKAEAEADKP